MLKLLINVRVTHTCSYFSKFPIRILQVRQLKLSFSQMKKCFVCNAHCLFLYTLLLSKLTFTEYVKKMNLYVIREIKRLKIRKSVHWKHQREGACWGPPVSCVDKGTPHTVMVWGVSGKTNLTEPHHQVCPPLPSVNGWPHNPFMPQGSGDNRHSAVEGVRWGGGGKACLNHLRIRYTMHRAQAEAECNFAWHLLYQSRGVAVFSLYSIYFNTFDNIKTSSNVNVHRDLVGVWE